MNRAIHAALEVDKQEKADGENHHKPHRAERVSFREIHTDVLSRYRHL